MSTTAAGADRSSPRCVAALAVALPAARRLHVPRRTPARSTCAPSAAIYRLVGVNPDARAVAGASTPAACWRSRPSRSCSCTLLQRLQDHLLADPGLRRRSSPTMAWNTAVSFVTNTNWQSYSGESTMGHLVQMAGLAVQNFVSAAVGIAVAVALVRGFARRRTDRLGNFWVDLTRIMRADPAADRRASARSCFIAGGMVQNLSAGTDVTTLAGGDADDHRRPGGQPGGHQGARHQRRRLLQRQLRPPVREPDRLDQLARDLPARC